MALKIKYLNHVVKIVILALLLITIVNRTVSVLFDYQYPFPREYRDGAIIDIANQFKQQVNPFSIKKILPHNYAYGFIPPLIIGTIGKLTGIGLTQIQLTLSLILSILTVVIVARETWKNSKNVFLSVISGLVTLIFVEIGFRPEIYAIFVTTFVLIISSKNKPKDATVYLLGATSMLLYYIKPYFILLSAVLFFRYLQFNNPKPYIIRLLASIAITVLLSCLIVNYLFPMYFPQAFVSHINLYNTHQLSWMTKQFFDFFSKNWSIFIAFIALSIYGLVYRRRQTLNNVYFLYTSISVLCLVVSLGQHLGTYLTYFNQLLPISIVLFICGTPYDRKKTTLWWKAIKYLFIVAVVINYGQFTLPVLANNKDKIKNWAKAINYISHSDPQKSYLSPHFTTIAVENSWPIYDNGQTEYFFAGDIFETTPKALKYLIPQTKLVAPMFKNWTDNLNKKIANREFSFITVSKDYHPLIKDEYLKKNYAIDMTIDLPINLGNVEFWKPIPLVPNR